MRLLQRTGVGRGSRFGIALQVGAAAVLALAAVLLVNWLTARPGVRKRFDLTASAHNTLSTATLGVLRQLEGEVRIEILYRLEDDPLLAQIAASAEARTERLLALIEEAAGGKVTVEVADLSDREAWRERAVELRVEGFENGLIVSRGLRRVFLPLLGRLAQFDPGQPQQGIGPRIVSFTAEEALVEAFLDVTRGEVRHAYFTFGFGELDVMERADEFSAGKLGEALEREGFRVHRWNSAEDGPLPANCSVLGVLGPTEAWPADMRQQIERYIDEGGRAVIGAAPNPDELERSDVPELLEARGAQVSSGVVLVFVREPTTGQWIDGSPECERLFVPAGRMQAHPMLAPFRAAPRGFGLIRSHQLRIARQMDGGISQVIAYSMRPNWLDAPPLDGKYDEGSESVDIDAGVLATVQYPPPAALPTPLALEPELESKLVLFGSSTAFMNLLAAGNTDLWRAAFNWVTDQDHRVTVSPHDPDVRLLPRDDPEAIVGVVRVAQTWLPLTALAIGILVARLRARGGPKRARPRERAA